MARSEPKALVGNAADEQQVATARQKEKTQRERELDDLRALLALPAGRRVLWRLMAHCHVWESRYETSARIHFNEGERNVGLFVLHEIQAANPEGLFEMMRENFTTETDDA